MNTIQSNLDSVAITSGPTSVNAGEPVAFIATGTFVGGQSINVSGSARWRLLGDVPDGTFINQGMLTVGPVTVPTPLELRAAYAFPSGSRESVGIPLTVYPTSSYEIAVSYSAVDNVGLWDVNFTAVTSGPEGAAQDANVRWDFDQDEMFNEGTGHMVQKSFSPLGGQTYRIGVKAEWPGSGESATFYFYLTLNKSLALGEVIVANAVDIVAGSFLDAASDPVSFQSDRADTGLVVLTHGVFGSGQDGWLSTMAVGIEQRLSPAPPNIATFDWKEMADPTLFRSGGNQPGSGQVGLFGVFQIDDVKAVRSNGRDQGVIVANRIERERVLGNVRKDRPIHLIGHSAGGFVVGETARLLNELGYTKLHVTMLDTPFPYFEHVDDDWKTERYITSWIGGNPRTCLQGHIWNNWSGLLRSNMDLFFDRYGWTGCRPGTRLLRPLNSRYYRRIVASHEPNDGVFPAARHSDAHHFYFQSVRQSGTWIGAPVTDGFNYSPFVRYQDFEVPPPAPAPFVGVSGIMAVSEDDPSIVPPPIIGFSTFGDVVESTGVYTVTEDLNAGLTTELTLPWNAVAVRFQLRFLSPGDGDFVSVHWNAEPPLGVIPETELQRNTPLIHEYPVAAYAEETGVLTFKLVSRGVANSVVALSGIELVTSDDLDRDGLTNDEELAIGSDPRAFDSDGDGLDDATEVANGQSHPALNDTDGDGNWDGDEITAGTLPNDPESFFRVVDFSAETPGRYTLRWPGKAGRIYRIQRSAEIDFLNFDTVTSGLVGIEGPMEFEDASPDGSARLFYRIEVE